MSYNPQRLAILNAAKKGEKITVDGVELGGAGIDGRQQYVIAFKPYNPKTGVPAYYTCGCGAWKFQAWRKKGLNQPQPCKHILAFLAQKQGAVVEGGATVRKVY
jgi:hypothetical protein